MNAVARIMNRPSGPNPLLRRVLWAAALSNIGDGVYVPALALLAADLTRRPLLISLVTAFSMLPWLILGPVSGAIVDRLPRRALMVGTDVLRGAILIGFAAWLALGHPPFVALIATAVAIGCADTLFSSAARAIIPSITGPDSDALNRANSSLQNSQMLGSRLLGPLGGGGIYGLGRSIPFFVDALSFAASALILRPLRLEASARTSARKTLYHDIVEGLRWSWRHPEIRTLGIVAVVANLAVTAGTAIVVLLARERLGLGAFGFGVFSVAVGAGAILGSYASRLRRMPIEPANLIVALLIIGGAAQAGIGATRSPFVAAACLGLNAFAFGWAVVLLATLRQQLTPPDVLGRVVAGHSTLAIGLLPFGAIAGGALASKWGLPVPFVVGGATIATTGILSWRPLTRCYEARKVAAQGAT